MTTSPLADPDALGDHPSAVTIEPTVDTESAPAVVTDRRRLRLILLAMCVALVAVVASVSGLNVAQQDLALELGASQSTLLWIINGYTLALSALLMPIGAIGDRWGRKPILMAGLVVFTLANLAAALSTTSGSLLVARVVAGVGAAMIMPVTLSVITSSFPPEQRARAVGIWSGFAGAGGILGLFFSSWVVDNATWPWVFALPIGLSVLSFAVSTFAVPNSREEHRTPFDLLGAVLSAIAIGGIVLGVHEGPDKGWTDPLTVTSLLVGSVALVGFVVWQLHHAHPLFEVRLFRDRFLAAGSATLVVLFAVMFGIFLVMVQFLQAVLGFSALRAATGLLPMALLMMPLSAIAPTIASRIGIRRVLVAGLSLFTLGLVLLATMSSAEGGYWSIIPGLALIAIGMGLAMSPATTAITESLPHERQGVASALNDTVRELGGAIGIALLGSILSSGYSNAVAPATENLPPELAGLIRDGIGTAYLAAPQLGEAGPGLLQAAQEAFVEGWHRSMWVSAGLAATLILFLLVRGPRRRDVPRAHTDW